MLEANQQVHVRPQSRKDLSLMKSHERMRFVFLKYVEELVACLIAAFFKINIISEVRQEGLSDGSKVEGKMELVMRETKK